MGAGRGIVDRVDELPYVRELIREFLEQPRQVRGLLLYSPLGFGKTAILDEVERIIPAQYVRVKRAQFNNGICPQGDYVKNVNEAFCSTYPEYEQPHFSNSEPSISLGLNFAIFTGSFTLAKAVPTPEDQRKAKVEALVYYCIEHRKSPIFILEDCQYMDCESADLILYIAHSLRSAFFVFEYSIGDAAPIECAARMSARFAAEIEMESPFKLDEMDFSEAVKTLPKDVACGLTAEDLQDSYSQAVGNLVNFETLCRQKAKFRRSAIEKTLDGKTERVVMCLADLFDAPVSQAKLAQILHQKDPNAFSVETVLDICSNLVDLCAFGTIDIDCVYIRDKSHARIARQDAMAFAIAYSAYLENMQTTMRESGEIGNWYHLLNAQLMASDEGVLDTLLEVKSDLCKAAIPQSFAKEAADFLAQISGKSSPRIIGEIEFALFDVFYTASDHEGAKAFLNQVNDDADLIKLFNYMVDSTRADTKHMKARAFDLLQMSEGNDRLSAYIWMTYLSYLMRFGERLAAKGLADQILSCDRYEGLPEYYWTLKLNAGFLTGEEAVIALQRSCEGLSESGEDALAARARLTYASRLAITGQEKLALDLLNQDYLAKADPFCRDYYYYNDIAACNLMSGTISDDDVWRLKLATMYPSTPYERVLMQSNLMLALILRNELEDAISMAGIIEKTAQGVYSTHAFRHLRDTNLLMLYRATRDANGESVVVRRLRELGDEADPELAECIAAQLKGTNLTELNELSYVTSRGYRPGFIGYWQMPLQRPLIEGLLQ